MTGDRLGMCRVAQRDNRQSIGDPETGTEWFLFLPQVGQSVEEIVRRAGAAEAGGFDGIAFFDHLEMPVATHEDVWEAFVIATLVAAKTQRLRIGHLVLCDAFRNPAVLAKQAVTLSAASAGRFELGLGSGSWPQEFTKFGIDPESDPVARVSRLRRSVEAIRGYWGVNGTAAAVQHPAPSYPIPLLIGGTGRMTLSIVRDYADWWNVPTHQLDRLSQLMPNAGSARVSVQQMVGFVRAGANREQVIGLSNHRFGYLGRGLVCGDAAELGEHFRNLRSRGVERFYVWFADDAVPDTLVEFAETVMRAF